MTWRDRRIVPFAAARAAAEAAPAPAVHWMIEERDPRLGVPCGRLACNPANAGELITGGAWSCLLSNVTCTACRRKFFSAGKHSAHSLHKPTTD